MYRMGVCFPLQSTTRTSLTASLDAVRYTYNTSYTTGVSSLFSFVMLFSVSKNGMDHSADLKRNMFSAANFPLKLCISLKIDVGGELALLAVWLWWRVEAEMGVWFEEKIYLMGVVECEDQGGRVVRRIIQVISPTRYYTDDSCWSADLKSKATEDIINIGSFMEVLVLNHYVLVRKILLSKVSAMSIIIFCFVLLLMTMSSTYAFRNHLKGISSPPRPSNQFLRVDSFSLLTASSIGLLSGIICFYFKLRHSKIAVVRATNVAIPIGVGNFIMAWVVEEIARSSIRPIRPKMMLYGYDARTTVNFIMVLLHSPSHPNVTFSLIFPVRISCSPENPTSSVWVCVNQALTDRGRLSKQCLNITCTAAP
nr:hypothetical protein [Tanacetum cinerariifolium]